MGLLFAAWSDKEVGGVIASMGIFFTAVSFAWVRISGRRATNVVMIKEVQIKEATHEDAVEDGRRDKWLRETRSLLKQQDQRIEGLEEKLAEKDKEISELRTSESRCQKELATLSEQGRWMKRILRRNGLLSDDDEESFPRTKSDQIDTNGGSSHAGG